MLAVSSTTRSTLLTIKPLRFMSMVTNKRLFHIPKTLSRFTNNMAIMSLFEQFRYKNQTQLIKCNQTRWYSSKPNKPNSDNTFGYAVMFAIGFIASGGHIEGAIAGVLIAWLIMG